MEAEKLNRVQVEALRSNLGQEPLANYELLWVLESYLETAAGAVYGLGPFPWRTGLMIIHRQCIWLQLENELLLEEFLTWVPEFDLYRFFTTSANTLDMLKRWLPGGNVIQSALFVRNLTSNWRKRFSVLVHTTPDPSATGGWEQVITDATGNLVATCSCQQVVPPWQEIVGWEPVTEKGYWPEQALGAVTATILERGSPVIIRAEGEEMRAQLAPLGYREFCQLFYYVAAKE